MRTRGCVVHASCFCVFNTGCATPHLQEVLCPLAPLTIEPVAGQKAASLLTPCERPAQIAGKLTGPKAKTNPQKLKDLQRHTLKKGPRLARGSLTEDLEETVVSRGQGL